MTFELPPLPYALDALAPLMSEETLSYHYGKHLQAYVAGVNRLVANTPFAAMTLEKIIRTSDGALFNNAAQVFNHTFFFETLRPAPNAIGTELRRTIERDFGSAEAFKAQWLQAATNLFGSGWTWLVQEADGRLTIRNYAGADNPLRENVTPLLTADVWEHAYYIDYRNRRTDYLEALWQLTDWGKVEARTQQGLF
ncbi:MAG: superoxide dismutase [Alloprevotella sp.]|nr:superoxide dismutase [Alloprevotella sp.]